MTNIIFDSNSEFAENQQISLWEQNMMPTIQKNVDGQIKLGMDTSQISEIVSDKLIEIVKVQFEVAKQQFNQAHT